MPFVMLMALPSLPLATSSSAAMAMIARYLPLKFLMRSSLRTCFVTGSPDHRDLDSRGEAKRVAYRLSVVFVRELPFFCEEQTCADAHVAAKLANAKGIVNTSRLI
jgi:hypothetical protein